MKKAVSRNATAAMPPTVPPIIAAVSIFLASGDCVVPIDVELELAGVVPLSSAPDSVLCAKPL